MAGMLQIITYLLAVYLIIKGCEILQIALCSARDNRVGQILFGLVVLGCCVVGAGYFVYLQEQQAQTVRDAFN